MTKTYFTNKLSKNKTLKYWKLTPTVANRINEKDLTKMRQKMTSQVKITAVSTQTKWTSKKSAKRVTTMGKVIAVEQI